MQIPTIDPYRPCPCGSGKKYKFCCRLQQTAISNTPPRELIKKSAEFPINFCMLNPNWQELGLATVVVIRSMPNGKFIFGFGSASAKTVEFVPINWYSPSLRSGEALNFTPKKVNGVFYQSMENIPEGDDTHYDVLIFTFSIADMVVLDKIKKFDGHHELELRKRHGQQQADAGRC